MPYQRAVLGPRYNLRLEELLGCHAVEIECGNCGHKGLVAPHRLHDRFAGHLRLIEIASRMRCRRCGRAGAMDWRVVQASPPALTSASVHTQRR